MGGNEVAVADDSICAERKTWPTSRLLENDTLSQSLPSSFLSLDTRALLSSLPHHFRAEVALRREHRFVASL